MEAARLLGVPVRVLQRDAKAGELAATRTDGGQVVRVEDLERWLEARQVRPGQLGWSHQVKDGATGRWRWPGSGRPGGCDDGST